MNSGLFVRNQEQARAFIDLDKAIRECLVWHIPDKEILRIVQEMCAGYSSRWGEGATGLTEMAEVKPQAREEEGVA